MGQFLSNRPLIRVLVAILLLVAIGLGIFTAIKLTTSRMLSVSTRYITLSVASNGTYTIEAAAPAWTFGGVLGSSLTTMVAKTGNDTLGNYREIVFTYQDSTGASRGGGMRTYTGKPIVLFTDQYLSRAANSFPFPRLTTYPSNLYHISYNFAFAQHTFLKYGSDSPWVYFDAHSNAFILSPASDFMVADMMKGTDGSLSSGIAAEIKTLPQGFTHKTFLVIGQGINSVYETWGHAMTDLQGKARPANDSDIILNTVGYWTDAGAAYYYHFDPSKGYAGTLLAVRDSFRNKGIPLGYMQLDGWFYPKGSSKIWSNHMGGIYMYSADPTLFPQGLAAFQQQLGLPLLTQAKFIDPSSPYHQQYTISNYMSTDPNYWNTVAAYLKHAGVVAYEQDFLTAKYLPAINLTDPEAFVSNMANAMADNGMTMQYCGELPRYLLQSSMYSNLATARVSGDHFARSRWDDFLFTSRLASALGIWPWSDVFMSTETSNLLLSTLSAGIVGVGDPIDGESKANLFKTMRADAVIVKPDVPIVPIDAMYAQDAQQVNAPMIAATYSDFGAGMKGLYIFAYARGNNTTATFTSTSLGLSGNVYVYNYFTGAGTVVSAGSAFSDNVTNGGSYYIVVPIGPSGIGFLGDAGKFVSLGKKRIIRLTDTGTLQATVMFASGETAITLHGYAPTAPHVMAIDGKVITTTYNSSTHLFSVVVSSGADGFASISIGQA